MRAAVRVLHYAALLALAAFLMAPFAWMVLVSLHPSKAPIPQLSEILPTRPEWENYATVIFRSELPVLRFFINSSVVAIAIVGGQLVLASMAAFAFSRLRFRGREPLFAAFLLSMMFSGQVTQIPVFLMMRWAGWLDTYMALILPSVGSAFAVFLLRQAFLGLPRELDEAAKLDGAGHWTVFSRVVVPACPAALATVAAFAFIGAWTDFFWPLIATSSLDMKTLEVGLSVFKNSYGGTNWPLQMTAAVVVLAPVLVVFLLAQRFFVRGVVAGSLK